MFPKKSTLSPTHLHLPKSICHLCENIVVFEQSYDALATIVRRFERIG
jgi:hypothetical protein